MEDRLELKALYTTLEREIESDQIQYMKSTTYRDIAKILGNLSGQGYDGIEASIKNTVSELIGDMVTLLLRTRLRKIKQSEVDYLNLTEEEQYIALSEKNLSIRFEQVMFAILGGRVKLLEGTVLKTKLTHILLRFLKAIGTITGVDDNRYGPFEAEDIAVLPFEEAKRLIEGGAAIEVILIEQ